MKESSGFFDRDGNKVFDGDILFFMLTPDKNEEHGQYAFLVTKENGKWVQKCLPYGTIPLFIENVKNSVVISTIEKDPQLLEE